MPPLARTHAAVDVDAGSRALAARIDDVLPQTQCTRCGYPSCRDYANAIASQGVNINRCPPGGAQGIERLAAIVHRAALPLDAHCGVEGPRHVAWVVEADCIGCALCIKACPVDCIVGAPKRMHTVIETLCTGCERCVPACPVDCIRLEVVTPGRSGWAAWNPAQALQARQRFERHVARRGQAAAPASSAEATAGRKVDDPAPRAAIAASCSMSSAATGTAAADTKRALIESAVARAQALRTARG